MARLSPERLLTGEEELDTFAASHRVIAADWGLRAVGGGLFARAFGIKGVEVVGGTLHLTTWRLIFTAQAANRFTGSLSVALPDITAVQRASNRLTRVVAVSTADQSLMFGTWNIARFIAELGAAREALVGRELARATAALKRAPALSDPFGPR